MNFYYFFIKKELLDIGLIKINWSGFSVYKNKLVRKIMR